MKKVGIIMGSDSDLPILRKTMDTLSQLEIPYECHIYSAHRTPAQIRNNEKTMYRNKINASGEEYLKWILRVQKEIGPVRSIDLAVYMGFSRASVSKAIKKLEINGFLNRDQEGYLTFTDKGLKVAESFNERHEFFTNFLISAGIDENTALAEACAMEHAVSEASFRKLKSKYEEFLVKEEK